MATILIADDEELIRRLIGDHLKKEGHMVLEAADGIEALSLFNSNKKEISLCILDIMMPEIDGWQLCKKIRETSGVPIMLVSARSQDFDQIMGFESGADDYVTKPFSLVVLSKRINTLLQRGATQTPTNPVAEEKYILDGVVVDVDAYEVTYNGEVIEFTVKEFELLRKFIKSPGRVYSRDKLISTVWGDFSATEGRTVDSHVARIRTKLGDWGNKHLITVYGTGYKVE